MGLSGTRRATRGGIRASLECACEVAAGAAPAISAGLAPRLMPEAGAAGANWGGVGPLDAISELSECHGTN